MTKALVLSGGGSVGIAWQTGLATGLARHGVDLSAADLIVGTSAGSAVGAQLALGGDAEERFDRYKQIETSTAPPASSNGAPDPSMAERMAKLMEIMAESMDDDGEPEARRAAIGKFALEADATPEEAFVGFFRYLHDEKWPAQYKCTAVDAATGEFVVWDEPAGVPLDRAVASSCCVPGLFSPITINGHRYMDGGMRSGTNADLAVGHDSVLIVTLMTRERMAGAADDRLARLFQTMDGEQKALADSGASVEIVGPDEGAAKVMGLNLMDAAVGPDAAAEGLRQGEAIAERIVKFWG
jgi:NTE family protein